MTDILPVFGLNAGLLAVFVLAQWGASLWRRDASLVDRYWGGGFALVAVSTWMYSDTGGWRGPLLTAMAAIWGLRLSAYLTWRNWGAGEDYRYRAMRARHGASFPLRSLATVFVFQGALTWFISLPLQVGIASATPGPAGVLDIFGIGLWAFGLGFEAIGDAQLARFKRDPSSAGRVMDRGLWRYTRHPNYFGDAMVWWGMFAVAASAPGGVYTVLSPILMQFLLMRVSGVALLERKLRKSRPGYAEYAARTNAFFPWRPRADRKPAAG